MPLAALVLSLRQEPVYSAQAEVLLRETIASALADTPQASDATQLDRRLLTQAELARSPQIAAAVLRAQGVRDRTVDEFLKSSSTEARRNTNLIAFGVHDEDRTRAVALATEYARQFIKYHRRLQSTALVQARGEVEARIAELEARDERDTPLYANLVEKQQALRTAEALESTSTVLVKPARTATRVRPQPLRSALLGLVFGAVLGLGLAYLWEALDTRVRSTREIERRLGLPLLGRLPAPPRWAERTRRLVMLADPNSMEAESFRVLRTNLEFFNMEHGARTIMVTSSVAGEGKSTTVANLAIALARAGRRVILVDLDLRKPTIDRFFDFEGTPGLTDVAHGRAKLAPVELQPDAPGGKLEVLTTGPLPRDTGEFVASPALTNVLDEIRERADVVLIDSPPILAVGDAVTLSAKVDAVIVLTRLGVVRRAMVEELRRALSTTRAAKLGFVVTAAELEQDERYGYDYGYGYGYGTGDRTYERGRV